MNKNEKEIILNTYKDNYTLNLQGFNKSEVIYTLKFMLDNLNLKKDRYMIENNCIAENKGYNGIQKEMYSLIFETFVKRNCYVNYDLNIIAEMYEELQWKMTDEENKCHVKRINMIQEYMHAG